MLSYSTAAAKVYSCYCYAILTILPLLVGNFIRDDHSNNCFPTTGNITRAVFLCCLLIALQWFHLRPLYSVAILILGVVPAWILTVICRKCADFCEDDEDDDSNYDSGV